MSGRGVLALACVLAAVTSGCAAKLREIPTHSLSKRSPAVVERDIHQCEKAVTGHLKGPWLGGELEFAACMIARNYQTFVQVLDAPLEVRRASLKGKVTSARVLNDLVACEQFVSARVSVVEKIGRPLVTVAGLLFWPVGFGASTASDRKSTRLNSSHRCISYAVFCLKKKKENTYTTTMTQYIPTTQSI